MGKGAGLCFSTPSQADAQEVEVKQAAPTTAQPAPAKPEPPTVPVVASAPKSNDSKMTANRKIAIVFYSTYGHIYQLAQKVKAGVDSVPGFEGVLLQVPEILPEEVLKAMHAPPKPDVPIAKAADLPQYDGIIFGAPTRFGMVAAQMKAFIDSTGGLWQSGALVGKPASVFVSVGTQGGGIETTALTFYTQLAHHGMVIVPTGYSFGERLFGMDEVRAGTAYGASTYAGPTGARQPSELELDYAQHQGSYFAKIAGKLTA